MKGRDEGDTARGRRREGERDGATGSGGISSESETDGQKYRHGNKEGK